jgi:5-(carboxyamino)imidazole ribonucleotide synthase
MKLTGKRIGIIGGGQLGRMLTTPAIEMGFSVTVIDPTPNCPAAQVGAEQIKASLTDERAIQELAERSDFLTYEIEHINTEMLIELAAKGVSINPSPETLTMIKNKLAQKEFLRSIGIPTADFLPIDSALDITRAAKVFGYPLLLKTRFGGYDGRGNALLKKSTDILKALSTFGEQPLYVEQHISFVKELAVMVARGASGEVLTYPVVETIHKNNILHDVLAPAPIAEALHKKAKLFAKEVVANLSGAGVFGIEMFLTKKGELLVNEIAPRVHNSGHYTIESCVTSQFEQHIRAITGLPLGKPTMKTPAAVMVNILGDRKGPSEIFGLEKLMSIPNVSFHIYGKAETKPERKMGHITVLAATLKKAQQHATNARKAITL